MEHYPIVLIEDDKDDCEFIMEALTDIGAKNEIRCFSSPIAALEYLKATTEKPFIIICDINMPQMNGFAFKRAINSDEKLHSRRIPFVFLSTSANAHLVDEAFHLCIQGYFQKPVAIKEYSEIAKSIIEYWSNSKLPQSAIN